ncbi:hypothetical protein SELMODRAFT_93575 [Selaginella moellendorffii]|uniref:Pentacotripeptide-repeat region of PRORP domain-containing protein n=1 Tax=Selaginella moellendorffii TaxID=88036 RepID=D8RH28_SELML|nr:hypothetical protein SELMODRAFT_93575 [Selaginella moellendorffii]
MRASPPTRDLLSRIRVFAAQRDLSQAKHLYSLLQQNRYCLDKLTTNQLMRMFGKCGSVEDARKLFDQIDNPDTVQWNIMVTAYAQNGHFQNAKSMFDSSPQRDMVSWNTMCQSFSWSHKVDEVSQCLLKMPQHNVVSWNSLLCTFAQNGHYLKAQALFVAMPEKDVISWNIVISQYAEIDLDRAKLLFDRAPQHSVVTWNVLIAHHCEESKRVFDTMPCRDIVSWNIIAGNAREGHLDCAMDLFDRSPSRSLALWNVILSGFASSGDVNRARSILSSMPRTDVISWNSLLAGLLEFSSLRDAGELFTAMPHRNLSSVVATALLDMYSRCGRVDQAKRVFDSMRARDERVDLVTWNAMIAGFARSGHSIEALELYRELEKLDRELQPDASTFAAVIDACASAVPPAVSEGRAIHRQAIARRMDHDPVVGSSLVAMYTRIGGLDAAQRCFDRITARNTVAWNSMLVGFANHGSGTGVIQSFHAMQLDGAIADAVTFVAVLSSCSHAGWIVEAGQCFQSMAADFFIAATPEHYSAIGDLFARLGQIGEARSLIRAKPYESSAADWMSLLSACRIHCDVEHGASAAAQAFEFGELDDPIAAASGTCKLLLGMFSAL